MIVTVVIHAEGGFAEGVYRGTPEEVMAKHFPQATRDPDLPGVYREHARDEGNPLWYEDVWLTTCHEVQD